MLGLSDLSVAIDLLAIKKFGTDYGAESNFGTHKELIVLNILKYEYCVNKSRYVSRDHLF